MVVYEMTSKHNHVEARFYVAKVLLVPILVVSRAYGQPKLTFPLI